MEPDRNHERMCEQLSALTDGEVDPAECRRLVDRLLADHELRANWERYHVARACLQGASGAAVAPGFSARVSAAVASEPVLAAPPRGRRAWP